MSHLQKKQYISTFHFFADVILDRPHPPYPGTSQLLPLVVTYLGRTVSEANLLDVTVFLFSFPCDRLLACYTVGCNSLPNGLLVNSHIRSLDARKFMSDTVEHHSR